MPSKKSTDAQDGDIAVMDSPAKEGRDWRAQAEGLAGQAKDAALNGATSAKNVTGEALHGLSKLIADTAETVDSKLGPQYGDYARRAAEGIGNFSESFRDKDVDELFNDARALIAKSPAVAVGAAAALGFVVARLARAGIAETSGKDAPEA